MWDVAYDGYNGGKDTSWVNWMDPDSTEGFKECTYELSKPYEGPSMMVMAFRNASSSEPWYTAPIYPHSLMTRFCLLLFFLTSFVVQAQPHPLPRRRLQQAAVHHPHRRRERPLHQAGALQDLQPRRLRRPIQGKLHCIAMPSYLLQHFSLIVLGAGLLQHDARLLQAAQHQGGRHLLGGERVAGLCPRVSGHIQDL